MGTLISQDSTWYVAQLKPHGLTRAQVNLERQGITGFSPQLNVRSRKGQKFIEKQQPLFPGYIFVSLESPRHLWKKVNNTFGISRLISFASQPPAPIPGNFIDGLMARCSSENVLQDMNELQIGEHVRAVAGPFTSLVGTIENLKSDQRIIVLFDILGQQTRTEMRSYQVTSCQQ